MKTLRKFIKESGGRARAAVAIGVAETTLWRWLEGRAKPRGLAVWRLTELGIAGPDANTGGAGGHGDKIARVAAVRRANEAFEKDDEEMLSGMSAMSPGERVADVETLRARLWGIRHGGARLPRMVKVARVIRRADAGKE